MKKQPGMHRCLLLTLAAVAGLVGGCVLALQPYNQASQEKLRIQSATPQDYTIRVADKLDYSVPTDGRVTVNVPSLERGCTKYLFGLKVKDASPYNVPAIHIQKGNHAIRKLSLNDLAKLPADEEGYRLVTVK